MAAHLVGFLKEFLKVFSELKGKKFYLTGESVSTRPLIVTEFLLTIRQYAGMYVSCEWNLEIPLFSTDASTKTSRTTSMRIQQGQHSTWICRVSGSTTVSFL